MIALNPRAPVCLSIACLAIAWRASDVNDSSTWSIPNSARYWGTKAFFGSVNILTSMSTSNEWNGTKTGKRPTNSWKKQRIIIEFLAVRAQFKAISTHRNHSKLNQISCLDFFQVSVTLCLVIVHRCCTCLCCSTAFRWCRWHSESQILKPINVNLMRKPDRNLNLLSRLSGERLNGPNRCRRLMRRTKC